MEKNAVLVIILTFVVAFTASLLYQTIAPVITTTTTGTTTVISPEDYQTEQQVEVVDLVKKLDQFVELAGQDGAVDSLNEVIATKDTRLVAPLIDLLRFGSFLGVEEELNEGLKQITGHTLVREPSFSLWHAWLAYESNLENVELPDGYLGWKGRTLSKIDPNFELFFYDDAKQAEGFRPELVVWGGVRVAITPGQDLGIPPLYNPATVKGSKATYMRPDDIVYGVVVSGQARAYPQRIVDWHEMINDEVDGVHFSVAYCTLCAAAVHYGTDLNDGTFRTFSSSGLLYQSNKLMFDRQTNTLWTHLTGEPVFGSLVGDAQSLRRLPIETTLWSDWLFKHPNTDVLDLNTGFDRDYSEGVPSYNTYYEDPRTMFATQTVQGPLQAKDRVFVIEEEGVARAFLRSTVWEQKVINDEFNNRNIVVFSQGENLGIKAFERSDRVFEEVEGQYMLRDQDSVVWNVTDQALESTISKQVLLRLPAHEAFWFGWVIFYPETTVYGFE